MQTEFNDKAKDAAINVIAYIAQNERPSLFKLLRKNGVIIDNKATDEELYNAVLTAFSYSPSFAKDLERLSIDLVSQSESYSNYVDDDFMNETGKFEAAISGKGTSALIASGFNVLGSLLDSSQVKSTNKANILVAQSQAVAAQAQAVAAANAAKAANAANLAAGRANGEKKPRPKWVIPVAIGAGVIIIGVTAYFIFKKKS